MSMSELFDMDCSSPVASTSAHPVAQRFLVDYAPPTHIKPIVVDQHPAPRRVKSPAQTVETQTTVSYISGDDNERIRRWLLATRQAFVHQQPTETKAKSAFSDSEDSEEESEEDSDSDSSCDSENDSESDSDRIFLQPRRHQQSSSSLPPHPRQAQSPSPATAVGNSNSKSSSPLPMFPRRRTAPGSVTAMMMSHLTAARPALPVVCLSEASGQVDISPSSSSFQSRSPSHSRSGSRDQPCRSRWSSSCSIQQPRSQPSWYEDDEDDSLNLPALVEDDECAPASTSTRSIPIPTPTPAAARFTAPRRARARGRATQRNPIEFGNADANAKFGLQSAFDDSSDEDEEEYEERQIVVEEEQWDEDYQSPPHRRALNAAKGHMDGQSFYNGWLSQYHNQSLVADDRA